MKKPFSALLCLLGLCLSGPAVAAVIPKGDLLRETPEPAANNHAVTAPFMESDVSVFANGDQTFYRLPSLLVTRQGTVLAAGQKRLGQKGDFAPSSLVLRRSHDGGRTFAAEQTLFEHGGDCTFNGNLVEDRQSGTLFACFIAFPQVESSTWFQKNWVPRGGGFAMVKSTDDGETWSAPIAIMPEPNADGWHGGGAFNNNHGVQLRRGPHAGRLVIASRVFKPGVFEGRSKGGLIYSDDRGATWRVGGIMLKDCDNINSEVTVGETGDGEVYVNSRNEAGRILARDNKAANLPPGIVPHQRIYSRSRDGGESFYEEGCHPELFDGPCNAGQAWIALGDDERRGLLVFTAPATPQRSHLTGYVSRDNGRSWTPGRLISEKSGGYSDSAVTPDKTILTLYENARDGEHPRGLLLARYDLEWLLGKKIQER
jgi:sialidase-1